MSISIKHEGAWKDSTMYTKYNNAWLAVVGGWVKQGGVWKRFYGFPLFGYVGAPSFISGYGKLVNVDIEGVDFDFVRKEYVVRYDENSSVDATQGSSANAIVIDGGIYSTYGENL